MDRSRFLALLLLAAQCGRGSTDTGSVERPRPPTPSVRISMADLHRAGGVPPGWRLSVPPGDVAAGRRAFVDLGCHSCHRVAGETFSGSAETGPGPELTGMGSHHPPEYFVESILNPDAVLVDGPGWITPDGHSVMPSYPDVTLRQLADLVAYLRSLRAGGAAELMAATPVKPLPELPPPPASGASVFYVQTYDVRPGQLAAFQDWFRTEGAQAFLAHDGLVGVETEVDVTHEGPALTTVLAFRDDAALARFLDDPASEPLGSKFDEFIGPHTHRVFRRLPLYRAPSLSAP